MLCSTVFVSSTVFFGGGRNISLCSGSLVAAHKDILILYTIEKMDHFPGSLQAVSNSSSYNLSFPKLY